MNTRTSTLETSNDRFAEKIALAVSRSGVQALVGARAHQHATESDDKSDRLEMDGRPIVYPYTAALKRAASNWSGPTTRNPVFPDDALAKKRSADPEPRRRESPTSHTNEASLLQASLQLLESQVALLEAGIDRLEHENDRLRRENQGLVRLIAKIDNAPAIPASGIFDWMRGLRLRSVPR